MQDETAQINSPDIRITDKANKDCFVGIEHELHMAETALSDCGALEISKTQITFYFSGSESPS